jgi:biopolymer transport protein ExbB
MIRLDMRIANHRLPLATLLLFLFLGTAAQRPAVAEPQPASPARIETNIPAPTSKSAEPSVPDVPVMTEAAPTSVVKVSNDLHELSPLSMFLNADILVKAVMIGLAFASVVTWTIFLAKSFELAAARNRLKKALNGIAMARSLGEAQLMIGPQSNILASLLAVAIQEAKLSSDCLSHNGIKERAASSFSEVVRAEARAIRRGTGLLATIGATAPFVGLFGTVWGIMNSFIGISKSQTTNLAVVAPGIAEALLATATGLVAAIPAVIIYNHFSRATRGYLDLVGGASGTAGRLLSRDLDRRYNKPSAAGAAE